MLAQSNKTSNLKQQQQAKQLRLLNDCYVQWHPLLEEKMFEGRNAKCKEFLENFAEEI